MVEGNQTRMTQAAEQAAPKQTFVPMSGRVAVLRDGVQEKVTESGIIVPEVAQERPQFATVLAVAETGKDEGEHYALKSLSPGMRVVLGKYSGADLSVAGHTITIVPVLDILGRIE